MNLVFFTGYAYPFVGQNKVHCEVLLLRGAVRLSIALFVGTYDIGAVLLVRYLRIGSEFREVRAWHGQLQLERLPALMFGLKRVGMYHLVSFLPSS